LAWVKTLAAVDREDHGRAAHARMVEAAVADLIPPPPVPFRGEGHGDAVERVLTGEEDSLAFDHDVKTLVPLVAPGRQHHVRVGLQVRELLLLRTGGKADGAVGPYRDDRGDMRPAIGADRGDPEQLGAGKRLACLFPPTAVALGSL
jgi:hypothetical protein